MSHSIQIYVSHADCHTFATRRLSVFPIWPSCDSPAIASRRHSELRTLQRIHISMTSGWATIRGVVTATTTHSIRFSTIWRRVRENCVITITCVVWRPKRRSVSYGKLPVLNNGLRPVRPIQKRRSASGRFWCWALCCLWLASVWLWAFDGVSRIGCLSGAKRNANEIWQKREKCEFEWGNG